MTSRRQFIQLSVTGAVAAAAASIPFTSAAQSALTAATSGTAGKVSAGSGKGRIKITQVRNATLIVNYAGVKFLIDPYLAEKEAYPGFEGTLNSQLRNPRVALKTPLSTILDVDAVIVTHTHNGNPQGDHWDEAAVKLVPKHLPLFAQHEADAARIRAQGFTDVRVLTPQSSFKGVSLSWTPGRHGTEEATAVAGEGLGDVCGIAFRHADEETLYLTGDTRWNSYVRKTLKTYKPDVIVMNAGFAIATNLDGIIMGVEDVNEVAEAMPDATLIASHLEAVNHCTVTRADLRKYSQLMGFDSRLLIPEDGETVSV